MVDQSGGKLGTEQLANEQSSQRATVAPAAKPGGILNSAGSGSAMDPWRKGMLNYMQMHPATGQRQAPVSPEESSKTLPGAADPRVAGGPKEIRAVQQGAAQNNQTVANPVTAQHNPPAGMIGGTTKGGSMNAERQHRTDTVRTLLKFAACMKKSLGKKKMKKLGEQEVPRTSAGGPLVAMGIGAEMGLGETAAIRNYIPTDAFAGHGAGDISKLLRKLPAAKSYGLGGALGAANLALPAWVGARAAKRKGGAGRGAAAGTGVGAGMGAATIGLLALLARKNPGAATRILKNMMPITTLAGAGVGAVSGAIGGGIQKRKRTKAQGAGKSKKEAQLRKKALQLKKCAGLPWGKIFGYGGLGAVGLGALGTAATVGPPAMRALSGATERYFDPLQKAQYDFQKSMYSPQMASLQMLRALSPYGGYGGGGAPPIMAPEDRDIIRYATYLKSLRARSKALQEAFE